jgi:hypothetical protein
MSFCSGGKTHLHPRWLTPRKLGAKLNRLATHPAEPLSLAALATPIGTRVFAYREAIGGQIYIGSVVR